MGPRFADHVWIMNGDFGGEVFTKRVSGKSEVRSFYRRWIDTTVMTVARQKQWRGWRRWTSFAYIYVFCRNGGGGGALSYSFILYTLNSNGQWWHWMVYKCIVSVYTVFNYSALYVSTLSTLICSTSSSTIECVSECMYGIYVFTRKLNM